MIYKEFIFTVSAGEDFQKDLFMNALAEAGFDTFEETGEGFKAYIPAAQLNARDLDAVLAAYRESLSFEYLVNDIAPQNWNQVWESNFEPLLIRDRCYVRATFHEPRPDYDFEIVVDPKMAFGTGHHQTTALMMGLMLDEDFKGSEVLDMGCGTGILAILASMLGAEDLVAIDYDPLCYESTIENAALNGIKNIRPLCGSKEIIPSEKFGFILANINRNILLDQIDRYAEVLKPDGLIFLSGFYEEPDLSIIRTKAEAAGLEYIAHLEKDKWVAAKFRSNVQL